MIECGDGGGWWSMLLLLGCLLVHFFDDYGDGGRGSRDDFVHVGGMRGF